MKYGLPYCGSKNAIAEDIISVLPPGNRLVDLFGGGGAITHCAMTHNLYKEYLYNELNPLVCNLFRDAISGKYNPKVFHPYWVSREQFHKERETNGYVACCWSFGSDLRSYIFSDFNASVKKELFAWVVDGVEPTLDIDGILDRADEIISVLRECNETGITERRLYLKKIMSGLQLQSLESLESLQSLERLEITNRDYREYEYREGDVVYCDPPYEISKGKMSSQNYKTGFNASEFYDWVATRDYPVYCSGYFVPDDRFTSVWQKKKISLINPEQRGKNYKIETVYCKKEFAERFSFMEEQRL